MKYKLYKRRKSCGKKEIEAKETNNLLCILELNYDLLKNWYANWPQLINRIIANNRLANFKENINSNKLWKLCCAVCSSLSSQECLAITDAKGICWPLFKIYKKFKKSFFQIDLTSGHPYIDNSSYKVILDKNRFIK